MKKSKFTDSQILLILKQAENGSPVTELCREHVIRAAFGGMVASMIPQLKWGDYPGLTLFTEYKHEQDYGSFKTMQIQNNESPSLDTVTFGLAMVF